MQFDLPVQEMFSHYVLYGAAALAEESGRQVRVSWSESMSPVPVLDGIEVDELAELISSSAQSAATWMSQSVPDQAMETGLFSPRIKAGDWEAHRWPSYQGLRREYRPPEVVFARLIQSLGEPAYWGVRQNGAKREAYPDAGASYLEMQPRNRGSNFMPARAAKTARELAGRDLSLIISGLQGSTVTTHDGAWDSRNGLNMRGKGPVDDAVSWLAIIGIGTSPLAYKVGANRRAETATSWTADRKRYFALPVWHVPMTLSRVRTLVRSDYVRQAAEDDASAQGWLRERSVLAVVKFPVSISDNKSAPESQAREGSFVRV